MKMSWAQKDRIACSAFSIRSTRRLQNREPGLTSCLSDEVWLFHCSLYKWIEPFMIVRCSVILTSPFPRNVVIVVTIENCIKSRLGCCFDPSSSFGMNDVIWEPSLWLAGPSHHICIGEGLRRAIDLSMYPYGTFFPPSRSNPIEW